MAKTSAAAPAPKPHEGNGEVFETNDPREELLTGLRVLYRPGQVVELRVPNYPRGNATTAGYFDDFDGLAAAALELSGKAPGIYVTLNEINPALLARLHNRVESWVKQTTTDADVLRRRWLPLDFDPVRPAGIPSTDAEHAAAKARAEECHRWLTERGWPDPCTADSGNGAHLLYAVDLPADDPSKALVEGCLKALSQRFSDDVVTVDVAVGNAARIWKLYGTVAAKGDGTDDRPHRRARLLNVPRRIALVTVEQLEALAGEVEEPVTSLPSVTAGAGEHRLDVARWLSDRGVDFKVKKTLDARGRTVYVLKECPFDPSHGAPDSCIMQATGAQLSAKCFHNSCAGRGWQEFKEALGPPGPEHYDPPPPEKKAGGGIPGVKIIPVTPPELGEAAYLGRVGEFLRAVAPYTEATDAGVLAHFLLAVGTLVGPRPYYWGGNRQTARLNAVLVGPTNAGRKGTSLAPVDLLMRRVGEDFWRTQRVGGLSSGEGLIAYVADKEEWNEETKQKEVVPVEKRLYVVEEEFSRVLANLRREGNVLSQVIREAFDSGNLGTLTVNPRQATGAHISIVGHITPEELADRLKQVEMANGFGNRFLWFVVKSDKVMPRTKPIPEEVFLPFEPRLRTLLRLGVKNEDRAVEMDAAAASLWDAVYPRLKEDRPGLAGGMVSRGAPMVLRLALIYTLLCGDLKSLAIRVEHLRAALAVWEYCEASARMLFESKAGDPLQDKLLELLAAGPMTKDEFNRHLSAKQKADVAPALAKLESANLVRKAKVTREGPGRPAERWERVESESR